MWAPGGQLGWGQQVPWRPPCAGRPGLGTLPQIPCFLLHTQRWAPGAVRKYMGVSLGTGVPLQLTYGSGMLEALFLFHGCFELWKENPCVCLDGAFLQMERGAGSGEQGQQVVVCRGDAARPLPVWFAATGW